MVMKTEFKPGDLVQRRDGCRFPGVVVSTFKTLDGDQRYVVEASNRDFRGHFEIFEVRQLEARVVQSGGFG